jgi:hypothetical protein
MKRTKNTPCRPILSPKEYYILKYNATQAPPGQEWGIGWIFQSERSKNTWWLPSPWARKPHLLNAARIECWVSSDRVRSLKPLQMWPSKGELFNAKQCSETFQTIRFIHFWIGFRSLKQVISAACRSTAGAGRQACRFLSDIYAFPSGFEARRSPCCPSLILVLLKLFTIPTMIH